MKQNIKLNEQYLLSNHPEIKQSLNFRSIIQSSVFLLIGCLLMASLPQIDDKSSAAYMAVMISGVIIIIFGLLRFASSYKHLIYTHTGSPVLEKSFFFDSTLIPRTKNALEAKDVESMKDIKWNTSGNARLDTFHSADKRFAAIRIYEYIPYTYEEASDIYIYNNEDAERLINILVIKK